MKIKTKIDVNYNNGLLGTKTGKITGVINNISIRRDFSMYLIGYDYLDSEGNIIKSDSYMLSDVEINALYESIKPNLPTDFDTLTEKEQTMFKYYNGFINIMAQTFNINNSDIEIIN